MKKILSLILAVLMAFTVVTFTVNAEEVTEPTTTETPTETPTECAHEWSKWEYSINPTCTEKGVKIRECALCGKDETAFVNAEGHSFGETTTVESTCATEGYTSRKCTKCGFEEKTNVIPAKPHTYGDWNETIIPTCATAGSMERICSGCNNIDKVTVPALGHDYVASIVAPTYEAEGYTLHKCSRCTEQYKDTFTAKLRGKVDSLELNGPISIAVGDSVALDLTGLKILGEAKIASKTYKSSAETVATIDKDGVIKGIGLGTATITCTVTDEYGNTVEDTVQVRVNFSILDWFKFIGTLIVSAITIVLGGLDFSSLGQLFEGLIPKE